MRPDLVRRRLSPQELLSMLEAHMTGTPFLSSVVLLLLPVCTWGQSATVTAAGLPAGNGRDIAAARCVSCHDASRLVTPGYTPAGWQDVIERMTKLGVVLSPAERPALLGYLARSFPPQPKPSANIVRGSAQV